MRIRSIYPDQWSDADFLTCSMAARLLALALRNMADDNGIFPWKEVEIKSRCLPYDNIDVASLLTELVETEQILRYESDNKAYGIIRNFTKYQKPKFPSFKYPTPDNITTCGYELHQKFTEDYPSATPALPQRYRNATETLPPVEESRVEESRVEIPPIVPHGDGFEKFDKFWKAYPKKVGKGAAEKAWKKIKQPAATLELILKSLDVQRKSDGWTKDNGQYIPNPATYLNQRRWEDSTAVEIKTEYDLIRERAARGEIIYGP